MNVSTTTAGTRTTPAGTSVAAARAIPIYVGLGVGTFAVIIIIISLLVFILSAQRRRKRVKTQVLAKVNSKNLPFETGNAGELEMVEGTNSGKKHSTLFLRIAYARIFPKREFVVLQEEAGLCAPRSPWTLSSASMPSMACSIV